MRMTIARGCVKLAVQRQMFCQMPVLDGRKAKPCGAVLDQSSAALYDFTLSSGESGGMMVICPRCHTKTKENTGFVDGLKADGVKVAITTWQDGEVIHGGE